MSQKVFRIFVFLLLTFQVRAQDIKGAYIRTNWIPYTNTFSPVYQYSITVILLTDASVNVPRPVITVTFTFGDTETYSLTNTVQGNNNTLIKTYSGTHTFPGSNPEGSYYTVQYIDTFWVAGIKNMSASQTQSFCTESHLVANPFFGAKNSGTLINFPPILGVSGDKVVYDLALASSNDSISYSLLNYCTQTGYYIPGNTLLNPVSGILSFPRDSLGLYVFNIKISEWCTKTNGLKTVCRTSYLDFLIDINATVGLDENAEIENSIKLYPNPTSNYLTIDNVELNEQHIKFTIYNITGQKLKDGYLDIGEQKKIDINFLESGLYIIEIINGAKKFSNKFIRTKS